MNTEFAHLDCSWSLLNYIPRKKPNNSLFFALTNIGIMFPTNWNKMLSIGKMGIQGKDIIQYIHTSPIESLFERHLGISGSNRSGSLRNGSKSPYYKFYTIKNLNLLKNKMLDRLDSSKTYFRDSDLYHLGDGMFEDAKQIDPYFAASLSEIREVKYSIIHKDRSQTRDRFTTLQLQMLINGELVLQKPTEFNSVVIPEYGIYLIDKNKNINTKKRRNYMKNQFAKGNKIRPDGTKKNIKELFIQHSFGNIKQVDVTTIMIVSNKKLGTNYDITNKKDRRKVSVALRSLYKEKFIIKNKNKTYSVHPKIAKSLLAQKISIPKAITKPTVQKQAVSELEKLMQQNNELMQQNNEIMNKIKEKICLN